MGNRVSRVKTEISEDQMAQAIIDAWKELFGQMPSKEQVAIILAQNALETGHRKSMWNFNVGNITTDDKSVFDYYDDLATDEQIHPGVWKRMNLKYRSYPSLKDGVIDYLRLLSRKGGRYAGAWQNIIHPDPVAFSKSLKAGGYYTADEAPYTKTLTSLFNTFNKSDSYDKARSGNIASPQPIMVSSPNNIGNFDSVLDRYVQMISSAEDTSIKKLYKKILPNHDILIEIKANDYTTAIEFSRILCAALDEDLLSTSYPHTDGNLVEIECSIAGPAKECFQAVEQMSKAIAETFKDATIKIGSLVINTKCIMNKKSFYQPINCKTAETNYRKFLLKFI